MAAVDRPWTEADAIARLVGEMPELRPLLHEHLEDHAEPLLPYVAFLRWFIDQVREGDPELARFVCAIEPLMTTDVEAPASDRVWNLAAVCFVDALQNDPDVVDAAWPWMGPNTSDAFDFG